jgi:hypothetical protein
MLPWGSLRWNQTDVVSNSQELTGSLPDAVPYCIRRAKRADRVLSWCPRYFPTRYAAAAGSVAAEEYPNGSPGGIGWFLTGKE